MSQELINKVLELVANEVTAKVLPQIDEKMKQSAVLDNETLMSSISMMLQKSEWFKECISETLGNMDYSHEVDTWLERNVDVKQTVEEAIDNHDFDDDIERFMRNYDMTDDIAAAMNDYDFSTDVTDEIESYDFSNIVNDIIDEYDFTERETFTDAVDKAVDAAVERKLQQLLKVLQKEPEAESTPVAIDVQPIGTVAVAGGV